MDILFDFRAEERERVTVVGTMSRALLVETRRASDLLGIRFRAGALPTWLRVDAAELRDRSVDLSCVAGAIAGELWDRLAEAPPAERPAIVRLLVPPPMPDPLVAHCVGRILASRGALPIARLEASSGASARTIERAFARHVGLGPKAFSRIVRFRSLVEAARAGEGGWADLAAAFDYADQPHMVREFRALAGLSPGEYRRDAVGFVQDGDLAAA